MKAVEFCYWLQGYFELLNNDELGLNREQTATVRAHLALVFKHEIDPSYSSDPKVQEALNAIHHAAKKKRPPADGDTVYRC